MLLRRVALPLTAALVLAACTGEEGPELDTAEVGAAEVVQTVAAPAQLRPAARAPVTVGVAGEVVELNVGDGDRVEEGEVIARLASEQLEQELEQAEQAVEAARSAGASATGLGGAPDLAPLVGSLRSQLDGVLPQLIDTLAAQVEASEAALEAAIVAVADAGEAGERARTELIAELEERDVLDVADELDLDRLVAGPDLSGAIERLESAQATVRGAREQLSQARSSFASASQELATAEEGLAAQASAAEEAQDVAVQAQVEQAQAALAATEQRLDQLTVVAPIDGTVQLERGGSGGEGASGAADLDGLPDLEGLDGLEGLGELEGLGDAGGATGAGIERPLEVGSSVGAGQTIATVFDLSRFTAEVEVDEIDVVDVAVGQPVEVIVDAFPGETIRGEVERVAIEPVRGATGGARYPTTVELTEIPDEVGLRVGLTASVEIEVARVDTDRAVPTSALLRRGEGEVVYVVRDGIAEQVPVELEAIGDEYAAIAGEVEPGEPVVTTGVELVSDGDPVEVER